MSKKILTTENLNRIRSKKISLAHGVFDVFHIGHKRHLENCKNKDSLLVVSVTADNFVNKGPGRPYFNENHRAELISALPFVDYVIINHDFTPLKLISKLKPKFYFKGQDYSDLNKDLTQNIKIEKKEVEKYGGKLVFTEDIMFSSSSIINKHFSQQKALKDLKKKIKNIKRFKEECLLELKKISSLKIAVIGEIIIDRYVETTQLSKPSKENIIAVDKKSQEDFIGGAFATAICLSEFVKEVDLFSAGKLKKKISWKINSLANKTKNLKITYDNNTNYNSILKKRYLGDDKKKMFEVYERNGQERQYNNKYLINKLKQKIRNYDLVIVNDFGHGLLNNNIKRFLEKKSRFLSLNVQTNAENRGFNSPKNYKKCDLLSLDKPELRLASMDRNTDIKTLALSMQKKMKATSIVITLGEEGLFINKILNKKNEMFKISGFESNPIDTMGAGDIVFALASVLNFKCKNVKVIGFIANLVGALKTNIYGHENLIKKNQLIKSIVHLLN